jgi:hypothetical protein
MSLRSSYGSKDGIPALLAQLDQLRQMWSFETAKNEELRAVLAKCQDQIRQSNSAREASVHSMDLMIQLQSHQLLALPLWFQRTQACLRDVIKGDHLRIVLREDMTQTDTPQFIALDSQDGKSLAVSTEAAGHETGAALLKGRVFISEHGAAGQTISVPMKHPEDDGIVLGAVSVSKTGTVSRNIEQSIVELCQLLAPLALQKLRERHTAHQLDAAKLQILLAAQREAAHQMLSSVDSLQNLSLVCPKILETNIGANTSRLLFFDGTDLHTFQNGAKVVVPHNVGITGSALQSGNCVLYESPTDESLYDERIDHLNDLSLVQISVPLFAKVGSGANAICTFEDHSALCFSASGICTLTYICVYMPH